MIRPSPDTSLSDVCKKLDVDPGAHQHHDALASSSVFVIAPFVALPRTQNVICRLPAEFAAQSLKPQRCLLVGGRMRDYIGTS